LPLFSFILFCRCKAGPVALSKLRKVKEDRRSYPQTNQSSKRKPGYSNASGSKVKAMDAPYRRRCTCFPCRPRDVHSAAVCSAKIVISVMDARCMTNPTAKKLQMASKARLSPNKILPFYLFGHLKAARREANMNQLIWLGYRKCHLNLSKHSTE
jgi:hypothetical protein